MLIEMPEISEYPGKTATLDLSAINLKTCADGSPEPSVMHLCLNMSHGSPAVVLT